MIQIDFGDHRPLYEQICDKIKELIISGSLEENDKIPSVRELAMSIAINPNTIQKAYKQIEREHPWFKGRKIDGVADPSIWDGSRGEAISDTAARYGILFTPGDNSRIPGWMQCHYRLQFDENGYSRMYVFSNCKAFIRTIPTLIYDEHKPEDLDTDLEDHVADDWRYAAMSRPVAPLRPVAPKKIYQDPLDQFKRRR